MLIERTSAKLSDDCLATVPLKPCPPGFFCQGGRCVPDNLGPPSPGLPPSFTLTPFVGLMYGVSTGIRRYQGLDTVYSPGYTPIYVFPDPDAEFGVSYTSSASVLPFFQQPRRFRTEEDAFGTFTYLDFWFPDSGTWQESTLVSYSFTDFMGNRDEAYANLCTYVIDQNYTILGELGCDEVTPPNPFDPPMDCDLIDISVNLAIPVSIGPLSTELQIGSASFVNRCAPRAPSWFPFAYDLAQEFSLLSIGPFTFNYEVQGSCICP